MKPAGEPAVIRVLVGDDHEILREGIRTLLAREPDIEVAGEAGNGLDLVRLARDLRPDVVVTDVSMPGLDGVAATLRILEAVPSCAVLCLSVHTEPRLVESMLKSGARGYVPKSAAAGELVVAVRCLAAGGRWLSPSVAAEVVSRHVPPARDSASGLSRLTPRERDVLLLLSEGLGTKDIADRLGISPKTALAHRLALMRKMGVDSTVALARAALREGLVKL